jgi:hypothetical protein
MRIYSWTSVAPVMDERHCRIGRAALRVAPCMTNILSGPADVRGSASRPCTADSLLQRGRLVCSRPEAKDRDRLAFGHTVSKLQHTRRVRSDQIESQPTIQYSCSRFSSMIFVSWYCRVFILSSYIAHSFVRDDSQTSKSSFCDERLRTTGRYSSRRAKDQHDTSVARRTITGIHAWSREFGKSQRPSPSVVLFAIPTTNVSNSSCYELLQSAPITTCTATFTSYGPSGCHIEP